MTKRAENNRDSSINHTKYNAKQNTLDRKKILQIVLPLIIVVGAVAVAFAIFGLMGGCNMGGAFGGLPDPAVMALIIAGIIILACAFYLAYLGWKTEIEKGLKQIDQLIDQVKNNKTIRWDFAKDHPEQYEMRAIGSQQNN